MTRKSNVEATARKDSAIRIVVPTLNRPEKLRVCLDALSRQFGGPYETIVVDDGGDGSLEDLCRCFAPWVTYLRQDNAGPAAARNTGIAAAPENAVICLIDDDCVADGEWVYNLCRAQSGVEGRLVGGRVENGLHRNPYASASQSICSYLTEFYDRHDSEMRFFTTNNMCFLASDFRSLGGFDEGFSFASEDRDLGLRWSAAGGSFTYCPEAVVSHAHDLTFRKLWRQQSSYGRGAHDLHQTMGKRTDQRSKFESLGFYFGLLIYPLRHPGHARLFQVFLIGVSHIALLWGYIAAAWEQRQHRV